MRRMWAVWIVLLVFLVSCAAPSSNNPPNNSEDNSITPAQLENTSEPEEQNTNAANGSENENSSTNAADDSSNSNSDSTDAAEDSSSCYPDEHPIAVNIAEQYSEMTDYDEVMAWFCQGAIFEDILNALTTEELSGVDAYELLQRIATGQTWDEIWVELGVVEK